MHGRTTGSGLVDIHTHYVGPTAAALLNAYLGNGGTVAGLPRDFDRPSIASLGARLRVMDELGVEVSVLSFIAIGSIRETASAIDLFRAANDDLLEACTAHSDRFVMAAALPLPDGGASLRELERISNENALRAVQIVAQTTSYQPDSPEFDDLFGVASDLGLPVVIHPSAGVTDLSPHFDAFGLSSAMHSVIASSLVTARMIQSGLLDRHPSLEIIVTHLGGILPFLMDRLDSRGKGPALFPASHYLRSRIWVDACGYPAGPALRCAIDSLGADRVLLGSDWPARPIEDVIEAIEGLGLEESARAAIFKGNAARWFDPSRRRLARRGATEAHAQCQVSR